MEICDKLIIGQSPAIQKIKNLVRQVSNSDLNVLICGDSGVGKELVAQALHLGSHRKEGPFVKVNCAAIPGELLESELFGYEKGAFTGADRRKKGKFEVAHRGTMLLDEIGDMALFLQSKMLQVLQDLQFSRLGSKKDVKVDCWIMAATNQDLDVRIREGLFRQDLYYRLNIIRIFIPPLRERPEDIQPLIEHFTKHFTENTERPLFRLPAESLEFLQRYPWPGNVRELKNVVGRLMLIGDWETVKRELSDRNTTLIGREFVSSTSAPLTNGPELVQKKTFPPLKEVKKKAIREAESKLIRAVLEETGWNRKQAAKILQISYKALLYKIKEFNLDPTE
ncbi:MAG: sigma-54-dependent Fis family transcriptional regulator [Deltaproteobacteria bacterium]|nr:MAG: sigma-54-dependent Fis family transcriptional regulator [Deltaproteobacteria bacterium]